MHAIGSDHDSVIQRYVVSHVIAISCMPDNSKVEDSLIQSVEEYIIVAGLGCQKYVYSCLLHLQFIQLAS